MRKTTVSVIALLASILFASGAGAHVGLVYPVGGETFTEGDMVTIEWEIVIDHGACDWDLYSSSDGGANWDVVELNLPKSQLSYSWTVPDVETNQGRIKIYQDNAAGMDYEDVSGDFTINLIPAFDVLVEIGNFYFDLAVIQIDVGQTVRWVNTVVTIHTSTALGGLWDSGDMGLDDTFDFTFNDEGVYDYDCTYHSSSMQGTVIVGTPDSISADIQIVDFDFIPSEVTVSEGDYVRWINFGNVMHTTTDTTADYWDSGNLESGEFFTLHADSPGDFYYLCSLHPTLMNGVLHVESAGGECDYVVGDVNTPDGQGAYDGLDIIYGVAWFGDGPPPMWECECTPGNTWYVSGDVNHSCSYDGLDIIYGVEYFKDGPAPEPCPDCPPSP